MGRVTRGREPTDGNSGGPRARLDLALIALLSGFLPTLLFCLQFGPKTFASALGVSLLLAGASFVLGVLLGFLFGIPKTVEPSSHVGPESGGALKAITASSEPVRPRYLTNTNLGQVSDWLTKILVGVGLTQISGIGDHLDSLIRYLEPGVGAIPESRPFLLALLTCYLVGGFMMGYLWTSIDLPSVLGWRDVAVQVREREALDQEKKDLTRTLATYDVATRRELTEGEGEEPALEPREANEVAEVALRVQKLEEQGEELDDPDQYLRLARQLKRAGEFEKAEHAYLRAAELKPNDPAPLNYAGVIRSRYLNDPDGAAKLYFRALALNPTHWSAVYNAACNEARRGNRTLALAYLQTAVKGDGKYRGLAEGDSQHDGPFAQLKDDPEFIEIVT